MTTYRLLRAGVVAALLLTSAAVPAATPSGPGTTPLLVTTYHVKPDHVGTWRQLQKDYVLPALRTAGVHEYTVYETVLGDAPEYTAVRPLAGFREFDEPDLLARALGKAAAARLQARLTDCLVSEHRSIENRRNEFLLDPGKAVAQYASLYRAMPGRSADYMTFFRNEMMPVMRKAQANGTFAGLTVTVSGHGGEWGLITLNMYYNAFAPLDDEPPVAKTLGPEGTRELLARGQGLITPLAWIVRRRVDDLSL
jgi:hypothetical protein